MASTENTSDMVLKYVYKRIIYFNSDCKDLIINTIKIIKDEIVPTNSCDKFEFIVYADSFGIYCNNENVIKQCEQFLISTLPDNTLIYPHYTVNSINFEHIMMFKTLTHLPLGESIFLATQVIKESIFKFTLKNIFLSFNGGKDCVVLLYLFKVVLEELKLSESETIKAVYFQSDDQFPEEEDYVQSTVKRFNLDLTVIKGDLKSGLGEFLKENPQFRASLIGTRQSDLESLKLQFFQITVETVEAEMDIRKNLNYINLMCHKTDPGWPELVRVHPILLWSYDTVWSFLRQFSIPYCCLYDKGYTSLGSQSKSRPNPNLKYIDKKTGKVKYWPAFLLQNSNSERENRF